MNWNNHSKIKGTHAFLSASKYHWINYDKKKLIDTFKNQKAAEWGTRLHAFAAECIEIGQKLPRSNKTLNRYVNDVIGYRMTPEQVLYYSEYCFGTADAISFKKNILRIFDYKSGVNKAHPEQLMIYAAIFCLEYDIKPGEIEYDLRIYQNDDVWNIEATADDILPIMDTIVSFDRMLNKLNSLEVEND